MRWSMKANETDILVVTNVLFIQRINSNFHPAKQVLFISNWKGQHYVFSPPVLPLYYTTIFDKELKELWIHYIFSIYLYTLYYIGWKWRRKMQITMRVKYNYFIHACAVLLTTYFPQYMLWIARESFRWNFQTHTTPQFCFICVHPSHVVKWEKRALRKC